MRRLLVMLVMLPVVAAAQETAYASRLNVGVNLMTLYSGLPEPQLEFYANKYLGVFAAAGYTNKPVRGNTSVDDLVDLQSLKGSYWKVGVKGRLVTWRRAMPWIQVLYVGSTYDEVGTRKIVQTDNNNVTTTYIANLQNQGTVQGFAIAPGVDFGMGKKLKWAIRIGYQVGYYKRDDHMGVSELTYQPGFGASEFVMPEQFMIGAMYRIGSVRNTPRN